MTSIIDGFKNYILHLDAVFIILYAWIAILFRNYNYSQEMHYWNTRNNPLFEGERDLPTIMTRGEGGNLAVSPLSLVPKVTSGRFAIIVIVILNNLNRY